MNVIESECWTCIHWKVCKFRNGIDKDDGFYRFKLTNCVDYGNNYVGSWYDYFNGVDVRMDIRIFDRYDRTDLIALLVMGWLGFACMWLLYLIK